MNLRVDLIDGMSYMHTYMYIYISTYIYVSYEEFMFFADLAGGGLVSEASRGALF